MEFDIQLDYSADIATRGMTKEEFEQWYCDNSGIPLELYKETQVTLPCKCHESDCPGWAAISNSERLINLHKKQNGGESGE